MIAGRDDQDALIALAVGPICDAPIVKPYRLGAPLSFVVAIEPQRLARGCVHRHHVAPHARTEVQNAAHHQGRHFPQFGSMRGPKLSARHRQAICRSFTLSLLICSSAEYFVLCASLP